MTDLVNPVTDVRPTNPEEIFFVYNSRA
jgi:hypothetical protein